jgi:hypothetical protein
MRTDKESNDKGSINYVVMLILASVLILAPTAAASLYYAPSSAVAQSSSTNQNKQQPSANATGVGKMGNVKQLAKAAGNNSQIIANNTKIGTGKTFQAFGKEHKVNASTPKSIKALPLHPQLVKANNMSSSAAGSVGGASNKTGANMTNATSSSTTKNTTGAALGGIESQHHLGGGKPAG